MEQLSVSCLDFQSAVAQLSLSCMKRYTNMEILAAIAGLAFIVFGLFMLFHPTEMTLIPPGFGAGTYRGISGSSQPVNISKTGSEVYSGLSVIVGSGLIWLALFLGRK
jgi:hypothetical protein